MTLNRLVATATNECAIKLGALNWKVVALDTETTGLRYSTLQAVGFSVYDGVTAIYVDCGERPEDFFKILAEYLKQTKTIIMHNAVFDAKVLFKYGIDISDKEWFDTMVASHLLNENRVDKRLGGKGHKLKVLAEEFLGADVTLYDEAVASGTHSKKFYDYAINDTIYTWELAHLFKDKLLEQDLVHLFREIEMPFIKTLVGMEIAGVKVDFPRVQNIIKQLSEKIVELETRMLDSIGEKYQMQMTLEGTPSVVSKINFNSSRQLFNILDRLGIEVSNKTKTGAPSIGKSTLMQLKGQHEFIDLLEQYKAAQKLLSGFFSPLPDMVDKDGRVRPSFHNTGTVTGRLSCSNPNMQQLPKENKRLGIHTRDAFIPSEGKKIIAVDYSQQELRIMAELSRDEKLIDIIQNKGDIHLINANLVFNLGLDEKELYEGNPNYDAIKKMYKQDRDKGKIFSFGIPYGMGPHKLSKDFNVTIKEAEELLANFFSGFPDLQKAIQSAHDKVKNEGYVTTLTGRRRHFERTPQGWYDSKALRQAFNFLIQSYGADLIRLSCINIDAFAKKHPHYGIQLLLTVHDEVVLECYAQYAEEVASKVEDIMESCGDIVVPLKAEAGIGDTYGLAK